MHMTECKVTQNPQLQKWSENTTMHGVANIAHSKSKLKKTIWSLLILTVMGASCYYVIIRAKDYKSHHTSTSFTNDYQTEGIEFPVVTVCNYNKFFYNKNSLGRRLQREINSLDKLVPTLDWADLIYNKDGMMDTSGELDVAEIMKNQEMVNFIDHHLNDLLLEMENEGVDTASVTSDQEYLE